MLAFKEYVMKDVAQGKDTFQAVMVVYHDQSVNSRFANRVEYGIETVIHGAGVNPWKVLL